MPASSAKASGDAASAPRVRSRPAPEASTAAIEAALRRGEGALLGEERQPYQIKGELAEVMQKTTAKHGEGAIYQASRRPNFVHVPTGIYLLDQATLGGIPAGLVTLLLGWKSSGKTTTALRAAAGYQRRFPESVVAYVDIEGTCDPVWARKHGVDTDRMVLIQPSSAEEGLDIADAVLRAKETSLMVVDSLAALIPTAEIEADMDKNMVGRRAMMIRRFCLKVQQAMIDERRRSHAPGVILINQFTMNIGQMYGDPRTMPGGKAPEYLASLMIELKNAEGVIEGAKALHEAKIDAGMADANDHTFVVKKNKLGNSIKTGVFTMIRNPYHPLGEGFIDDAKTTLTEAKKRGLVTGGGASWRIAGCDDKFRNVEEMVAHLYSDFDFFEALKLRMINDHREVLKLSQFGADYYEPARAAA